MLTAFTNNMSGYIESKRDETHWVGGVDTKIPPVLLKPDGNWASDLPPFNSQKRQFETEDCSGFNSIGQLEIYLRQIFGVKDIYSPRALGILAGTDPAKGGNDPQTVYESLRRGGAMPDAALPFSPSLATVEDYYKPAPLPYDLIDDGMQWLNQWVFNHEWIDPTSDAMLDALKLSPLGVAVYAWQVGADGKYIRPNGEKDCHWTTILHGVPNEYWVVLDSYEPYIKYLAWDFGFTSIKRISVQRRPTAEQLSYLQQALNAIIKVFNQVVASLKPNLVPQPLIPMSNPSLDTMNKELPRQSKFLWDTPSNARHSVRLICDEMKVPYAMKDDICRVLDCESGFNPKCVHPNVVRTVTTSVDYGICQINDYWHIGQGKDFPSTDYVLNNPEADVRWLIKLALAGKLNLWVCYSSGIYKTHPA